MHRRILTAGLIIECLLAFSVTARGDNLGTAFTYQGQLDKNGQPVDDTCDVQFAVYDAMTNGNLEAGPTTVPGVVVSDGLFEAKVDFGDASIKGGRALFLEIAVQCGDETMPTALAPRQELSPAPHALALPGLYTRQNAESPIMVGGYSGNLVDPLAVGATIGGGGRDQDENSVTDVYATVAGGLANVASGQFSTVSGGRDNAASGFRSTVSGGSDNVASNSYGSVGGGFSNQADGASTTIGGGWNNAAGAVSATVAGGEVNAANGAYSTIPGGNHNTASGDYSFAAGRRAKATPDGSFVWADAANLDFPAAGEANFTPASNKFMVRSTGGVVFVTAINGTNGVSTAGVQVAAGGGSWSSLSDRNAKDNVAVVDGFAILEKLDGVPVSTWNYKSQDRSVRHIGPMAQDFSAAFGVGADPQFITAVDADGVALAAIKALHKLDRAHRAQLDDQQHLIETQQSLILAQANRIADLERRLSRIEAVVTTTDMPSRAK